MMKFRTLFGTLALLLSLTPSVHAQTCTPLLVVKGDGISVTKRVSAPNAGILPIVPVGYRGNWDTDFAIPSHVNFSSYVATVQSASEDPASYKVKMYLKYSDDTADKVFNDTVRLQPGELQQMSGIPRSATQPYQVNLNVGGMDAIGHSYTISVAGCP